MMIIKYIPIFILLSLFVMACPSEETFRDNLKKGLFDYLQNPAESRVTLFEVKDMLVFYLTTNISSTDCDTVTGTLSGLDMSTINTKAASVHISVIPRCSDGTLYGDCSTNKPMFCYSGLLRIMCHGPDLILGNDDDCNCPEFELCQTDGSCQSTVINCFSDSDCGTSSLVGVPHCDGNQIVQEYLNFTCDQPGTPSATCGVSSENQTIIICANCFNGTCV